ncbi:DnaJ protein-like 2 [Symbiodinium microadriaticum]|uniref:DnaJ protein-like 2 n=1 Tax=Symbiodinium microadriaticum TaxID=2951 RepID=A0A1Q9EDF2_SYMMI|nr:DnaJ protein-like 2 [Symbiodinium microadriaticum]
MMTISSLMPTRDAKSKVDLRHKTSSAGKPQVMQLIAELGSEFEAVCGVRDPPQHAVPLGALLVGRHISSCRGLLNSADMEVGAVWEPQDTLAFQIEVRNRVPDTSAGRYEELWQQAWRLCIGLYVEGGCRQMRVLNESARPVLGFQDIIRAYRQRALEQHPDKGGDKDDFDALNKAYATLNDDARRRAYDLQLAKERERELLVEGGRSTFSKQQLQAPMPRIKTAPTPGSKRQAQMRTSQPGKPQCCAHEWICKENGIHDAESLELVSYSQLQDMFDSDRQGDQLTEQEEQKIKERTQKLLDQYTSLPRNKEKRQEWTNGLRGKERLQYQSTQRDDPQIASNNQEIYFTDLGRPTPELLPVAAADAATEAEVADAGCFEIQRRCSGTRDCRQMPYQPFTYRVIQAVSSTLQAEKKVRLADSIRLAKQADLEAVAFSGTGRRLAKAKTKPKAKAFVPKPRADLQLRWRKFTDGGQAKEFGLYASSQAMGDLAALVVRMSLTTSMPPRGRITIKAPSGYAFPLVCIGFSSKSVEVGYSPLPPRTACQGGGDVGRRLLPHRGRNPPRRLGLLASEMQLTLGPDEADRLLANRRYAYSAAVQNPGRESRPLVFIWELRSETEGGDLLDRSRTADNASATGSPLLLPVFGFLRASANFAFQAHSVRITFRVCIDWLDRELRVVDLSGKRAHSVRITFRVPMRMRMTMANRIEKKTVPIVTMIMAVFATVMMSMMVMMTMLMIVKEWP